MAAATAKKPVTGVARKRYIVKTTCYFNSRFFAKGDVVEMAAAITPPEHFSLIEEKPTVADTKKGLTE